MDVTLASSDNFDGARIGLFGGSFNPAHDGHLEMSLFALARLKLDAVWWLVSPGNPLKKNQEMQAFSTRFESARALTKKHENIIVTAIENELDTRYTIDTVRGIKKRWPLTHFVWLMGEDNLRSVHLWREWKLLFSELPIAVFKRSGYSDSCERGEAAATFAEAELPLAAAENLVVSRAPAWVLLDNKSNPLSATQIRQQSQPT